MGNVIGLDAVFSWRGGVALGYAICAVFFIFIPVVLGLPFSDRTGMRPSGLFRSFVQGLPVLIVSVYPPAAAAILMDASLSWMTGIWCAELAAVMFLIILYQLLRKDREEDGGSVYADPFFILAVILVLVHIYIVVRYMYVDDDDSIYVAMATTALDTDSVWRFNPFSGLSVHDIAIGDVSKQMLSPLFALYASVSHLSGIRPAVLCHTFVPGVMTAAFYGAFYEVAHGLFRKDRRKASLFLIFLILANVYSYTSPFTAGTFLLIRSWQGKAQIVGLIIPLLISRYLILDGTDRGHNARDYIYLTLLLGAAGVMTAMGCLLAAILAVFLAVSVSLVKKDAGILLRSAGSLIVPAAVLVLYVLYF